MTSKSETEIEQAVIIQQLEHSKAVNVLITTLTLSIISSLYALGIRFLELFQQNFVWMEVSHILIIISVSLLVASIFLRYGGPVDKSETQTDLNTKIIQLERLANNQNITMIRLVLTISVSCAIGIRLFFIIQQDKGSWWYILSDVSICIIVCFLLSSFYFHRRGIQRGGIQSESDIIIESKSRIKQLEQLRVLFITIFVLTAFSGGAIAIKLYNINKNTNLDTISSILISISVSLLVANMLQFIRDKRFLSTINDTIADQISMNVIKEVNKIKRSSHAVLPDIIYWSKDDNLLDEQKRCFTISQRIRFLSISAKNLLCVAIPAIKPNDDVYIELLLMNPTDTRMINLRSRQVSPYEAQKNPDDLRNEIIGCVLKAHHICTEGNNRKHIFITIRFHNEIPFSRIEFADSVLYLSFYQSQKAASELGPVSEYKRGSDIYKAYMQYFKDVWDKNRETEIDIKQFNTSDEIKSELIRIFQNDESIATIIDSSALSDTADLVQ